MYRVNEKIIFTVKFCFFLGMPLLVSFVLEPLRIYRWLSVAMVLLAFYLHNLYPAQVEIEDEVLKLKLAFIAEWQVYTAAEMVITQQKKHLLLCAADGRRYRISMEKLSVRLYEALKQGGFFGT